MTLLSQIVSNMEGIVQLKQYLAQQFEKKDLVHIRHFLDIEVAQSKDGVVIFQRKYALNIVRRNKNDKC